MLSQEVFLLEQLESLEADIRRFIRMLDALRAAYMRDEKCSDIDAEFRLQLDPVWKQVRRQQNAARRSWLSFNRELKALRKANPAPAHETQQSESTDPVPTSPQASTDQPPPQPTAAPHAAVYAEPLDASVSATLRE